ncbi:MAG: phosphoenolpyruvate carboxykinase (ATP), partial [Planctomycetota bacterium]
MPKPAHPLRPHGIHTTGRIIHNAPVAVLYEETLKRGLGSLGPSGQLLVRTGAYTGRSPNDRFIVREPSTENEIDWGEVNRPFEPQRFASLKQRMLAYLQGRDLFVQDAFAGAALPHRISLRVTSESPWHALFARTMFLRPSTRDLQNFDPRWTILHAPFFEAHPELDGTNSQAFVIIHFGERTILIGGTRYAGEIKKSIFSVLNRDLPHKGVLTMHCSANKGREDGDVALFFGLSGTGKTTLSADPLRVLIGDDEHGWSEHGVFNFEGGCYAKAIRLSREAEPEIWSASHRFGTILENVVFDEATRELDLDAHDLTENTRSAYPVHFIPNVDASGLGGVPKHILFLTCDAFGVLPPLSRLTPDQALMHFLAGYTAKVAGTERGVTEPKATFSACFGAPFLPLPPARYAELLGERLEQYGTRCWLVNTGWTAGPYGRGHRIAIAHTRALINAVLAGTLDDAPV